MTRAELLRSPEYWKAKIQIALYNCAESFMKKNGKNRKQLAEYLGVSSGYVTQILNGDYDHKLSKLAELSLAFGYVPHIEFIPIEQFIINEQKVVKFKNYSNKNKYRFSETHFCTTVGIEELEKYWSPTKGNKEVA